MTTRVRDHGAGAPAASGRGADRRVTALLIGIVVLAAAVRVPLLTAAPPGLNQDEAINAWDSYCLLKTGKDSNGVSWPIFYTHGFGANRSALFLYLLLPFEAIGGLGVESVRLAGAAYGVAAVALMFYVGRRLFDPATGLVAAGLLAIVPWHVQLSRSGHEATLGLLLVVLPVAALLKANLPFLDREERPPSAAWSGAAGALAGLSCYGYPAVRIFLPLFLAAAVLASWRAWWRCLRTPAGARALAALAIGVAATFGPLLARHLTDAGGIGERGQQTWVWDERDSAAERVAKVVARYPRHFGPDFLFLRGDHVEFQAPPGGGQLRWFMLPLLAAGAIAVVRRAGSSPAARLLLTWVVAYPAGDLLSSTPDGYPHALRSFPGLGGLILLAAVGAVAGWQRLRQRGRRQVLAVAAVIAVLAAVETARFVRLYFVDEPRRPYIYHAYHTDLMAACERLRPRLDAVDAVFCTTGALNMPYAMTLVGLRWTPERWFAQPRTSVSEGVWDYTVRAGKLNFLYGRAWEPAYQELVRNGRDDRVVFLVRPGELGLRDCPERIDGPPGTIPLLICERIL